MLPKYIMPLAGLVALSSCCAPKVAIQERVIVIDSIVEKLRDTTIYIELEKVVNSRLTLTTDTSYFENAFSTSTAYVANDLLYHTLEQKQQELPFKIKYVDKYRTVVRDSITTQTTVVEVNKLTRWQSFRLVLADMLGVALLLALAFVALRWRLKGKPW